MKAAVVQLKATNNIGRNIDQALDCVYRASKQKAKLIVLPEIFNFRGDYKKHGGVSNIAENIPGLSTRPFMDLAKVKKVSIVLGSVYEKSATQKSYNTSVFISSEGKIVKKYRKMNLFKAKLKNKQIDEAQIFLRGKTPTTVKTAGFSIGLSICYDLRFAELYKTYMKKGVDAVCIPSAFTYETGKAHWEILCRARAIETRSYVLAPNQYGTDERGIRTYGHSMIIDPWGKILKQASTSKQEILYADLDKKIIRQARAKLPMDG